MNIPLSPVLVPDGGRDVARTGLDRLTIAASKGLEPCGAWLDQLPARALTVASFARYRSRVDVTFGDKLLSAMRYGFGGHVEIPQ